MLSGMNRRTLLSLLAVPGLTSVLLTTAFAKDEKSPLPPKGYDYAVTTRTDVEHLPSVKELPDPFRQAIVQSLIFIFQSRIENVEWHLFHRPHPWRHKPKHHRRAKHAKHNACRPRRPSCKTA